MSVVFAVLGGLLVICAWASVLATLVVARRSRNRTARIFNVLVIRAFRLVTDRLNGYERRDHVLSWQAAAVIIVQLTAWLLMFFVGFALMLNAIVSGSVADAFAQSGSSLFTLGYAGPSGASLSTLDYLAAATGLIVIALQVGYLPTLYGSFSRRETEVRLLSSRAGTPAWGPEILARTRFGFDPDDDGAVMDAFYLNWERWAADVAESHSNYPVLTIFRSPLRYSSWVVALLAVMDSAALWLALSPSTAPQTEARLCLRMGFTALRQIGESLRIDVDHDPDPDSDLHLTYEDYLRGIDRIDSAQFSHERTAEQAWPDFRGWRINYESVAYALADRLDAVPARWAGPRRTGDQPIDPIRPTNRLPTGTRTPVTWQPDPDPTGHPPANDHIADEQPADHRPRDEASACPDHAS